MKESRIEEILTSLGVGKTPKKRGKKAKPVAKPEVKKETEAEKAQREWLSIDNDAIWTRLN